MMSEFGHIEATVNKTKDSHACLKYMQICQLAFSKVCVSVILLSKGIGGFFHRSLAWKGMQLWARKIIRGKRQLILKNVYVVES